MRTERSAKRYIRVKGLADIVPRGFQIVYVNQRGAAMQACHSCHIAKTGTGSRSRIGSDV